MTVRAAIYCRISDDRDGDQLGVRRQQRDCEALAKRNGWTVAAVHVDNDVKASGYSRRQRPEYRRMLASVNTGDLDAVVVWHVDRLYRHPRELEDLIDLAKAKGVRLATCSGPIDLATGDGIAMARILVTMAAKESDDKSRRLRRKHVEIAEAGRVGGGGRRPFGYLPDRIHVDRTEAALVREARDRILAGDTLRAIALDWQDRGVQSVTGARWATTTVKRLLCSARITGQRSHHGRIVGPAVWEPIITPADGARLRAVLTAPERNSQTGVVALSHLLTGVAQCQLCGSRMTGRRQSANARGGPKPRYWCLRDRGGCNRCGIDAAGLELDVEKAIIAAAVSGRIGALTAAPDDEPVDRCASIEAELSLLAEDYAGGVIGRDAFAAASRSLQARLDAARDDIAQVRARRPSHDLATADDPAAVWQAMTFDRKRAVLADLIDYVEIGPANPSRNYYDPERIVDIKWRDEP